MTLKDEPKGNKWLSNTRSFKRFLLLLSHVPFTHSCCFAVILPVSYPFNSLVCLSFNANFFFKLVSEQMCHV